jgi:hypothetical protein
MNDKCNVRESCGKYLAKYIDEEGFDKADLKSGCILSKYCPVGKAKLGSKSMFMDQEIDQVWCPEGSKE